MGEVLQASCEIAIVQDVVVAERSAFGEARGAAGILDVDGVVKLLLELLCRKLFVADRGAHCHNLVPAEHAGQLL